MLSYDGPPMTLGGATAAQLRLIVWCKDCRHQIEPDPADMAPAIRRRNARARLEGSADLLQMRQPSNRYGGYWRAPIAHAFRSQVSLARASAIVCH
jgi:hypothetical protein